MERHPERIIPKQMRASNGLLIEHTARYKFASEYVEGKVLDLACGVGYGTEILLAMGERIEKIIGVDIDQESIEYAKENYQYPLVEFRQGDGTSCALTEELGKFDSIVSMETVEHIKDDYKFISNLKRLLKKDGTLIISTPFGDGRGEDCANPYHYRQYTEEEYKELLSIFSEVDIYYQRGERIEKADFTDNYYLMVAVCKN